jgi:hypothetical protein
VQTIEFNLFLLKVILNLFLSKFSSDFTVAQKKRDGFKISPGDFIRHLIFCLVDSTQIASMKFAKLYFSPMGFQKSVFTFENTLPCQQIV